MMFSYVQEVYVRRSAFKRVTIGGLAIALGISVGLLTTQSPSRAQQQKVKEEERAPAPVPVLLQNYSPVTAERLKNPARRRLADDSPHL